MTESECRALETIRQRAKNNLTDYCKIEYPAYKFPEHIQFIIKKLEELVKEGNKRYIFNLPPRHGKSLLISILFVSWYLGNNPENRIIMTSYSDELSSGFSSRARNICEDKRWEGVFQLKIAQDSRSKNNWNLSNHRGGVLSTGIKGGLTGHGADLLLLDDPYKNMQEARSKVTNDVVISNYDSAIETRLEPNASILLVMTRWTKNDLTGHLINNEPEKWEIFNFPSLAESGDILGRKEGQALWEERKSKAQLEFIKQKKPHVFFPLYQGRPTEIEGNLFKRSKIQFYDGELPKNCRKYGGDDPAWGKTSKSDFFAHVDLYKEDGTNNLYVHNGILEHMGCKEAAQFIINQHKIFPFEKGKMESNNGGNVLYEWILDLCKTDGVLLPYNAVHTSEDKLTCANRWQPLVDNGTMKFNRKNSGVLAIIEQMVDFTGSDTDIDDGVDAISRAVEVAWGECMLLPDRFNDACSEDRVFEGSIRTFQG